MALITNASNFREVIASCTCVTCFDASKTASKTVIDAPSLPAADLAPWICAGT